ncbi:uncharacterized protein B0T15DRAFT_544743 [Chaetomium strumarium]|uniref:Uncharacterized protein n=1 Tax=Chaetomium strumarium TaxID=1170767 RepID=A0AAJ0LY11_9PEZI|nr:hypothetical protein B0T15DRAFT_544743 [Chaetomium strumarium]
MWKTYTLWTVRALRCATGVPSQATGERLGYGFADPSDVLAQSTRFEASILHTKAPSEILIDLGQCVLHSPYPLLLAAPE